MDPLRRRWCPQTGCRASSRDRREIGSMSRPAARAPASSLVTPAGEPGRLEPRRSLQLSNECPTVVSCARVRGCDGSGAPGRLDPGRDAAHASSVRACHGQVPCPRCRPGNFDPIHTIAPFFSVIPANAGMKSARHEPFATTVIPANAGMKSARRVPCATNVIPAKACNGQGSCPAVAQGIFVRPAQVRLILPSFPRTREPR